MTRRTLGVPLPTALVLAVLTPVALAGCGGGGPSGSGGIADEVRLGYFANLTHTTANVGVAKDYFTDALGDTTLTPQIFNAGPEAVEALLSGSLDASYIGPNPAINAFATSDGEAIRIVAGATSGGASLVVRPGIDGVEDLRGTTLATPQQGNTQDVALRAWLADNGLASDLDGGGDVAIAPTQNATTLQLFQRGELDGAWVPEPWATRLVLEGGGKVLLDERTLWPEGRFVTTHLIVRTAFLEEFPGTVKALLEGHVAANAWIAGNPEETRTTVNAELERLTGTALPAEVLDVAYEQLEVTNDPVAASLAKSAADAEEAGLLDPVDLTGIYDLRLLNEILAARGAPAVEDNGLQGDS